MKVAKCGYSDLNWSCSALILSELRVWCFIVVALSDNNVSDGGV